MGRQSYLRGVGRRHRAGGTFPVPAPRSWRRKFVRAGSHRRLVPQTKAIQDGIAARAPRPGTARWFAAKGRAPDDVVPARTLRRRLRARAVQP